MIKIYSFSPTDYFGSNCYLVESGGEYAVIDPSVEYKRVIEQHPEALNKIKYILLTHCHFDHIYKINSWSEACKNVIVGFDDAKALSDSYLNGYWGFLGFSEGYFGPYRAVKEGDTLDLDGVKIEVIGCPGHTPGGVSYKIQNHVFCGDTLFAKGGYGRCDLPGGDIDALEKSLIKLITHLPDDTVFYPGHGEATTLYEAIQYFK